MLMTRWQYYESRLPRNRLEWKREWNETDMSPSLIDMCEQLAIIQWGVSDCHV
jgi:hypothetical protein